MTIVLPIISILSLYLSILLGFFFCAAITLIR
jgi:hypothetical protein